MATIFEWDPAKASQNERKHDVTFDLAVRALSDPLALTDQVRIENGEHRWTALGCVTDFKVLAVVHTVEHVGDDEVVRIISARVASPRERRRYAEEIR
jgi:uncharacterized DUF497 family protein